MLFFMFLFGTSAYGMEPNTGDIDKSLPLSTRSIYSQRSLKYLLVYLIKGWDCFKDLTDDQILEKLDKLPKEFIESFELVSILEKCYTNDEKKLLLACMLDEVHELDESIRAIKQELFLKIIKLKHVKLFSLVANQIDTKAVSNVFFDQEKNDFLQNLNFSQPALPLLFFAIIADCLPIVNILCELGADISEQVAGATALGFAIGTKNIALTKMLLERSANPNIKLFNQETLLHVTAQSNCPEMALLLFEYGVDINSKNAMGSTPLLQAAIWGSYSVVSILVNCQAILIDEFDNLDHASPLLMCMKRYCYQPELEQLAKLNGYCNDLSILTLEKMIISLLDHGANINAQDINGFTTLMYACFFGFETIVTLLLSRGADVRITNNAGETALSIAQEKGHTEIIALLE